MVVPAAIAASIFALDTRGRLLTGLSEALPVVNFFSTPVKDWPGVGDFDNAWASPDSFGSSNRPPRIWAFAAPANRAMTTNNLKLISKKLVWRIFVSPCHFSRGMRLCIESCYFLHLLMRKSRRKPLMTIGFARTTWLV